MTYRLTFADGTVRVARWADSLAAAALRYGLYVAADGRSLRSHVAEAAPVIGTIAPVDL